jgi:hypothetical protein
MRKGIVNLLTHDGVNSCYCGVGTISRDFVRAMPEVSQRAKSSSIELTFNVVAPFITSGSLGYSRALLDEVTHVCHSLGGRVYSHCNATDGQEPFGNTRNWKVSSMGAATLVLDQVAREDYDFNITYGFDAPYYGVAELVGHLS